MSDDPSPTRSRQSEQRVCAIADALRGDDEVILNHRARPIEVLGREVQHGQGLLIGSDYPYRVVWLRGNGTEYRLRYSHLGTHYPMLHTESELVTRESFSPRFMEPRKQTMAKPGSGTRVIHIQVEGVTSEADWALARNIDGLEEATGP